MDADVAAGPHIDQRLDPAHGWQTLAETAPAHLFQRRRWSGPFYLAGQSRSAPPIYLWVDSFGASCVSCDCLAGGTLPYAADQGGAGRPRLKPLRLECRSSKNKRRILCRCAFVFLNSVSVEVESYLRDLLNRLSVEPGGFELILPDCVKCCILENRRSADELGIGYSAIFAHRTLHHHRAGNVARSRDRGINGCSCPDQLQRLELRLLNRCR